MTKTLAAEKIAATTCLCLVLAIIIHARQAPPQPADGRAGGAGRGGTAPGVAPMVKTADTDAAAAGTAIWVRECASCHGAGARGAQGGPNLILSRTVNFDRSSAQPAGSVIGPFLKGGHPTQTGKPSASFTDQEIFRLSHFLRLKVNETMGGTVLPENVLTGDAKAGEAFFNGEGTCTHCHNGTARSLDGIATRITDPQALQARVFYPGPTVARGGGPGGAAPGAPPPPPGLTVVQPNRLAISTTVTSASEPPMTGTILEQDSFFITLRDDAGVVRTFKKGPTLKIVNVHPLQWHLDFADRLTDKQMHDLTAYLWSLK